MSKQTITFGTAPTGIGGDSYKTAFGKVNENFTELYNANKAVVVGSLTRHTNVASYYQATASAKGAIVIHLPVAKNKSTTMLNLKLSGFNYLSNKGAWELQLGGYNYTSGWMNYSAGLTGIAPFTQVQFGQATDHQVIILGVVDTTWAYPAILLKEIIASYANMSGWDTGITITLETALTAYTGLVTPILYGTNRVIAAEKFLTARTINGVSFNGTANITVADSTKLPLAGGTLTGQLTTKATAVAVAIADLGVGATAPIKIPAINVGTTYGYAPFIAGQAQSSSGYMTNVSIGVYKPGSDWTNSGAYIAVGGKDSNPTEAFLFQNGRKISNSSGAISLVGNADTATKLATARTIHGVSFDGSTNITLPVFSASTSGVVPARSGTTTTKYLREDGTWVVPPNTDTTYTAMTAAEATAGTATTARAITPAVLKSAITTHAPIPAVFTTKAGLVPARVGTTTTKYLREDGTWVVPTNTTYAAITAAEVTAGTATTARLITPALLKTAVITHAPVGGQFLGTATNKAIAYNAQTIAENITIPATYNGLSAGPITINDGFTVTIADGATWTIV